MFTTLPLKYKIFLCIVTVIGFSLVGAADFTKPYKYSETLTIEEVTEPPQTNIDPIKLDELSNSDQQVILSKISGDPVNSKLPSELNKEGYLSINGQLYTYEIVPFVSINPLGNLIEGFITITLLVLSLGTVNLLAPDIKEHYDNSIEGKVIVILMFIILISILPIVQITTFSMISVNTGEVTYLGPTDSTENAIQYSELSYHQQAYVSTLISHHNSRYGTTSKNYENKEPITLLTNMPEKQLHELDTVVITVNGDKKYHNFVTTTLEDDQYGINYYEWSLILGFFILLIVTGISIGINISYIKLKEQK